VSGLNQNDATTTAAAATGVTTAADVGTVAAASFRK